MEDLFSKCGSNCGRCPGYKDNVKTMEDRQRGSDGWKKYFNFKIRLDRMYCDGCQALDEEKPVLLLSSCTIRKCAIINGVETCAHCSGFHACMHDLRIFNPDVSRKKIEARMGSPMPEEDYIMFIEPFEHLKHLDKIRASLDPEKIVEAKVKATKPRIVDFPDKLPFSREEMLAYKALHTLLSTVASISGETYAQQVVLKKRKQHILKLLWTFGLFGELKESEGSHLMIDSDIYCGQKLPSNLTRVKLCLEILKEYGVKCEIVPLAKEKYGKKGWLTPMGWLRKKGWLMKMSFDDSIGGLTTRKALKNYTANLKEKYGKRAFAYFSKVDMRPLMKE